MSAPDSIPISLFRLLREHFGETLQPMRCTKATLVHVSHTLEDLVLSQQLPALLFTGFQESSHWREETTRYRALAAIAQQVCIFAGGPLPPESSASELHVTLHGDDPLRQEWFLALLCPQFAVLLCGQDCQITTSEEALRQFDTLWSFQPLVINQVLDRLEQVIAAYRPERLEALREARQNYPPVAPDPNLITRFTADLIRFEERLQQRLTTTNRQLQQMIGTIHTREAQLRAIGDNLPNGFIYQVHTNTAGQPTFTYLSSGVEQVMGVSPTTGLQLSLIHI